MQFTNFRDRPLLFIDLEMTGLDPTQHEIIEAGALVVDSRTLEIKQQYETKVQPEHIQTADPAALRLNGYKPEQWTTAPSLPQVLKRLNELAPGGMIAGWNVTFDWMFLELAYRQHQIRPTFDYHKIDVLAMAWARFYKQQQPPEIKLSQVADYFKIVRTDKHRALADIKTTYEVFRKLIAE